MASLSIDDSYLLATVSTYFQRTVSDFWINEQTNLLKTVFFI